MSYFLPSPFAPPNSPLILFRRTQTPIYSALPSNSFIAIMYLGYSYGSGERLQQQPHFLDACFLCHKPLPSNSDIFMYRGNTPFCSKECRQEQIEVDESSEMMTATAWKKKKKKSLLPSSSANSSTRSAVTSPSSASTKAVRTGTVAVA